jgi:probable rRNA maturation factor
MRIRIYFENEQDKRTVSEYLKRLLRRAIRATLASEGFTHRCELSVTLTDNEGIHALNREYRGIDRPTDVLSFPQFDFYGGEALPEGDETVSLGDIVLSLERAEEQAREFGHSFSREAAFLTVHSVLHLLGYDHELGDAEDADMRSRQRNVMKAIGLEVV